MTTPLLPEIQPYYVNDIINEGGFLGRDTLSGLVDRLSSKKNLILQGPPGTGKNLARETTGQGPDRAQIAPA